MNTISKSAAPISHQSDTTKLVSLLALATGAVAIPQSSQADIIYTDLTANPAMVGFTSAANFLFDIPGTANVGFARQSATAYIGYLTASFRSVIAGDLGGGAYGSIRGLNGFVVPLNQGDAWNQGPGVNMTSAYVGTANDLNLYGGRSPASDYNNRYLAWNFIDDSPSGGGNLRYGWVEINLNIVGYNAGGPTVTVLRYGWENSGVMPTMGQTPVPEPTSGALMVMGAMAFGARGLRKWRQNRQPVNQA